MFLISIHALRVEGDNSRLEIFLFLFEFLSTPSGWRATMITISIRDYTTISIHALRVEGDVRDAQISQSFVISIHALRVEGDGGTEGLK